MRVMGIRADGTLLVHVGAGQVVLLEATGLRQSWTMDHELSKDWGPWKDVDSLKYPTAEILFHMKNAKPMNPAFIGDPNKTDEDVFQELWLSVKDSVPVSLKAGEPHLFTHCMEEIVPAMAKDGHEPSDPNAFCGWWKAQHKDMSDRRAALSLRDREAADKQAYDLMTWDECIAQNQDKDNPKNFCGYLKARKNMSRSGEEIVLSAKDSLAADGKVYNFMSWDECVKENQDKDSPEGFCAYLKNRKNASVTAPAIQLTRHDLDGTVGQSWASYASMDECIVANGDKDNPAGFCAYLRRNAAPAKMQDGATKTDTGEE